MKTLIIAAFATAVSFTASASGTKEKSNVSFRCIQNFEREFGLVDDVKWSNAMNNMTKADFVQDEDTMTAFFDQNGDFVAFTQAINFKELPKQLRNRIKEKLPEANITNVFKMSSRAETAYFFEIEKDGIKQLFKGHEYGDFTKYYVNN